MINQINNLNLEIQSLSNNKRKLQLKCNNIINKATKIIKLLSSDDLEYKILIKLMKYSRTTESLIYDLGINPTLLNHKLKLLENKNIIYKINSKNETKWYLNKGDIIWKK